MSSLTAPRLRSHNLLHQLEPASLKQNIHYPDGRFWRWLPSGRGGPGELEMVSAAVKHLAATVKELQGRVTQLEEGRH